MVLSRWYDEGSKNHDLLPCQKITWCPWVLRPQPFIMRCEKRLRFIGSGSSCDIELEMLQSGLLLMDSGTKVNAGVVPGPSRDKRYSGKQSDNVLLPRKFRAISCWFAHQLSYHGCLGQLVARMTTGTSYGSGHRRSSNPLCRS